MMPGLTPVAAAARGVRGESQREGVEWTCADLMPAAYLISLHLLPGKKPDCIKAISALATYH